MTMPSPRGNAGNVLYNPGAVFAAVLGSTEPTDLTTAWDAAWIPVGYTDQGSQFDYQIQTAEVKVEEELDPIAVEPTGRTMTLRLALAELTAKNIERAYNGGVFTPGTSGAPGTYEPPDLGQETRIMLGYESEDSTVRAIFRRCINVANISTMFKRAPQKAVLPVEFRLERIAGTAKPFHFILAASRTGT